MTISAERTAPAYLFPDDVAAAVEECYERGWTDGWPVVPPTPEGLAAMLATVDADPDEVLGLLPPGLGELCVRHVALNALLAGCRPEYLPVVLAATRAIMEPRFNVHGAAASTGGAAPLFVINGPARKTLDFNAGCAVFGPGWRANATVGRAIRLLLRNVGGALPGVLDQAQISHPGRYTYCIAENEEVSPWTPLHVERGFAAEQSTVTAFPSQSPRQVNNHHSRDAEGILLTIADTVARVGTPYTRTPGEFAVVIGQEHAKTLAEQGWTKAAVKEFLFEHAQWSLAALKRTGARKGTVEPGDEERLVRVATRPEDVILIVAGGPVGRVSAVLVGRAGHIDGQSGIVPMSVTVPVLGRIASETGARPVAIGGSVDPTSRAVSERVPAAPRPATLRGARVGLLHNSKANSEYVLKRLEELLRERYGAEVAVRHIKTTSTKPVTEEMIADFLAHCEVVVNAVGD